jgi:hypothetical protein
MLVAVFIGCAMGGQLLIALLQPVIALPTASAGALGGACGVALALTLGRRRRGNDAVSSARDAGV